MRKTLAILGFGALLGACVVLALSGKLDMTGAPESVSQTLGNAALSILGVLGMMVAASAVWSVYNRMFGKDYSGDAGIAVGFLFLGANVLLAIGCVIAAIASAPLTSVLIVAAVVEAAFTAFACFAVS